MCSLQYGNMLGLPWRLVLGLQDDGWMSRGEVIWSKRNSMPEGRYAEVLNIPFVFSSNGDGFVFHDRTGSSTAAEDGHARPAAPRPHRTPPAPRRSFRLRAGQAIPWCCARRSPIT